MDIEKLIRHNERFVGIAVEEIERFKVAPVSSSCLCDVGGIGRVRDKVIHLAAYVDAGFATGVEDKQVVFRWRFFVLKNAGTGCLLFVIKGLVLVRGTPYTNWMASRAMLVHDHRVSGQWIDRYFSVLIYLPAIAVYWLTEAACFQDSFCVYP